MKKQPSMCDLVQHTFHKYGPYQIITSQDYKLHFLVMFKYENKVFI